MVMQASQLRLLLLASLLLCTSLILGSERAVEERADAAASAVFSAPPAYLHARDALAFDLSGLRAASTPEESTLVSAARVAADPAARAYTHLALAVYYKSRGLMDLAREERRKGEYWQRIAARVPTAIE